ncbi:MAG: type II toxin-antitoxin system VapC family toxin [Deltaproteobacteria bacterium]|nr:type II toxin-antitoxin system VapC family toxin [Deltaproteobacteria bacterium]
MNGNRYFFDTNAIIYLLKNSDSNLLTLLNSSEWIGISIISQLEFLSFSKISENDLKLFDVFTQHIEVVEILSSNIKLINDIIRIRKTYSIKLPDAIVAASAIYSDSVIITNDKHFNKVEELTARTL